MLNKVDIHWPFTNINSPKKEKGTPQFLKTDVLAPTKKGKINTLGMSGRQKMLRLHDLILAFN